MKAKMINKTVQEATVNFDSVKMKMNGKVMKFKIGNNVKVKARKQKRDYSGDLVHYGTEGIIEEITYTYTKDLLANSWFSKPWRFPRFIIKLDNGETLDLKELTLLGYDEETLLTIGNRRYLFEDSEWERSELKLDSCRLSDYEEKYSSGGTIAANLYYALVKVFTESEEENE